ncbi:MAG: hypothetical protein RL113_1213 [Pseudomonadota bacterium]|jgi:hypothetical protein
MKKIDGMKSFLVFMSIALCAYADTSSHLYEKESGMILYEIKGGTKVTPETKLTIHGESKLRFKDWGNVRLEEESGFILLTGAIQHKQYVKRLEKHTKDTVITADYDNEQLLERKKNAEDRDANSETSNLMKIGVAKVAGLMCDVWVGNGVKKCIYDNILLKLEAHVLDVTYVKEAVEVTFDINTSNEQCTVPDYPLQEFALFNDKIKTTHDTKTENFCKVLKDISLGISPENVNFIAKGNSTAEREKFLNEITKDIFARQKKLLPELLQQLKVARVCIQKSTNMSNVYQCLTPYKEVKRQMGVQPEIKVEDKEGVFDQIEDEFIELQSRISCVDRSKNIIDLSGCMK